MATTQTLTLQISDNARQAATNIRSLTNALTRLQNALNPTVVTNMANQLQRLAQVSGIANLQTAINTLNQSVNTLNASIGTLVNRINQIPGGRGGGGGGAGGGNNGPFGPLIGGATAFHGVVQRVQARFAPFAAAVRNLGGNVLPGLRVAFNALHQAADALLRPIGNILHTFGRVATMRLFRYIIRQITTAFRDGLEHVREYSKAINGLYARDMAELDNKLLKVTNSLGAALAPAIQALLPTIHQLANYLIDAANAFNQFMALLNGHSSWTRAIDVVAEDFENTEKSANGAAKAAKNLLASWDELNIIQSKAAGSGGGSGKKDAYDYTKMFEEVYDFDSGIFRFVNFLEEHLGVVLGLLATIGLTLLGVNAFAAAAIVSIGMTFAFSEDILENGITAENIENLIFKNLLMLVAGAGLGFQLGGVSGAALGAITGFSLGVLIDLILDLRNAVMKGDIERSIRDALGITAIGTALGALFTAAAGGNIVVGALVGFAVGALVSLIVSLTVDRDATDEAIEVSEEDLRHYVASHMFETNADVTINMLNARVTNVSQVRKALAEDIGNASVILHNIRIGINSEENYNELIASILGTQNADGTWSGGLIGKVQEYASAQTSLLKTNFALMPVIVNGEDMTTKAMMFGINGWDIITTDMHDMGKELSEQLSLGFTDGVANFDEDAVMAMTQEIIELNAALTNSQLLSTAQSNLVRNLTSGNMTAADAFAQYQDELYQSSLASSMSTAAGYEGQAAYFRTKAQWHPDQADYWNELADQADAWATLIRSSAVESAEQFRDSQMQPGIEMLISAYKVPENLDYDLIYNTAGRNYDQERFGRNFYNAAIDALAVKIYGRESVDAFNARNLDLWQIIPEDVRIAFGQDIANRNLTARYGNAPEWLLPYMNGELTSGITFDDATADTMNVNTLVVDSIDSPEGRTTEPIATVPLTFSEPETSSGNYYRRRGNQYTTVSAEETAAVGTNRDAELALLRQQNDLLRQILNKPMVAQVGVSSALGRTVKQSMDLWDRTSGNTRTVSID